MSNYIHKGELLASSAPKDANKIRYNNTDSGLESKEVQSAIDELNENKVDNNDVYSKDDVDEIKREINESITPYFPMTQAQYEAMSDEQIKALIGTHSHAQIVIIDKPYVADDVRSLAYIMEHGASGTLLSNDVASANALFGYCEHGTNENGEYYKYADGLLICIKKLTYTTTCNKAWGSMYETENLSIGEPAHNFVSAPMTFATIVGGYSLFIESITDTTGSFIGRFHGTRPNSAASIQFTIGVMAIGRWK